LVKVRWGEIGLSKFRLGKVYVRIAVQMKVSIETMLRLIANPQA
jgi:hypothetical protein